MIEGYDRGYDRGYYRGYDRGVCQPTGKTWTGHRTGYIPLARVRVYRGMIEVYDTGVCQAYDTGVCRALETASAA